eukprot:s777_g5.t1
MPVPKDLWPNLCLDLLIFEADVSVCFSLRLEDESIRRGKDLFFSLGLISESNAEDSHSSSHFSVLAQLTQPTLLLIDAFH